jgi:predicted NBD/HSP70 family sugar kinase
MLNIGLDVGSTTLKCAVSDGGGKVLFRRYERHFSQVFQKTEQLLREIRSALPQANPCRISVSGSVGMGLAGQLGLPFIQEVYATKMAVESACRVPTW